MSGGPEKRHRERKLFAQLQATIAPRKRAAEVASPDEAPGEGRVDVHEYQPVRVAELRRHFDPDAGPLPMRPVRTYVEHRPQPITPSQPTAIVEPTKDADNKSMSPETPTMPFPVSYGSGPTGSGVSELVVRQARSQPSSEAAVEDYAQLQRQVQELKRQVAELIAQNRYLIEQNVRLRIMNRSNGHVDPTRWPTLIPDINVY